MVTSVIIVDDDRFILASMRRTLRKCSDAEIEYFDDAVVALEKAKSRYIGMFICDYQMPGMDGIEFMRRVSKLFPAAKRVLLSGRDRSEIPEAGIHIHRYLTKPVDSRVLRNVITDMLAD